MVDMREEIRTFIGASHPSEPMKLWIPTFRSTGGGVPSPADKSFSFPGRVSSFRDIIALSYIFARIDDVQTNDSIRIVSATDTHTSEHELGISFIIGGRSNPMTLDVLASKTVKNFFKLECHTEWKILCNGGGVVYSIRNPGEMTKTEYENSVDYGFIQKTYNKRNKALFIVSGLGSRATAGCGLFFYDNWHELYEKYGSEPFGIVIKFPPERLKERPSIVWMS